MFTPVHISYSTQSRILSGGKLGGCKVCICLTLPDNARLFPHVNASSVPTPPWASELWEHNAFRQKEQFEGAEQVWDVTDIPGYVKGNNLR